MKVNWHPIAAETDLPFGHIHHAELLGRELAVWRSASGAINVWENRCPHRGVRLTIGTVDGDSLRCRYHGWTFGSGAGSCSFIPAHPGIKPAAAIAVRTYVSLIHSGLVWTSLDPSPAPPCLPFGTERALAIRAVHVPLPGDRVVTLLEHRALEIGAALGLHVTIADGPPPDDRQPGLRLLVQPVNDHASVIRGIVDPSRVPHVRAFLMSADASLRDAVLEMTATGDRRPEAAE